MSVRQVVDGQQRIRTLLSFIDPSCLEDRTEEDEFTVLRSHNADYYGLPFVELPENVRAQILETQLPTVVLPSRIADVEVLRIFQRLNSTGLRLNAQELRNAEFYGDFKDLSYSLAYSQHQRWLSWQVFDQQKIARMLEVEFTSDLLGLLMVGVQARTKATIDKLYRDNDSYVPDIDRLTDLFVGTCDLLDQVFGREQSPSSLKRFRSTGWIYSSFALVSGADYHKLDGSPREPNATPPPTMSPQTLAEALNNSDRILRAGRLPDDVLRVLRGATADRSSRLRRISFIRENA